MTIIKTIYLNEEILCNSGTTKFYIQHNKDDKYTYGTLLDSENKFICNFYSKKSLDNFLIDIQNVKHISELPNIGVCLNVMWSNDLLGLYYEWLEYIEENQDSYSYEDFCDDIPVNVVKNDNNEMYFIINYNEV